MNVVHSSPIEEHVVGGRLVRVKRDDLCVSPPFPPLGKVRGLDLLLNRFQQEGCQHVGVFESSMSQVGLTLALACRRFEALTPHVFFVQTEKRPYSRTAREAGNQGAVLTPLRNNVLNVCFGQANRMMQSMNGAMIPFGFDFPEAKRAVSQEAQTVPPSFTRGGSLVISAGSGVTASSVLNGLKALPSRAIAVSTGRSRSKIQSCIERNLHRAGIEVEVIEPEFNYSEAPTEPAPFPCDPWYDLKAWKYLRRVAQELPEPILFWNVGA